MGILSRAYSNWVDLSGLARVASDLPKLLPASTWSASRLLSQLAQRAPDGTGLLFEDRRWTWREIDCAAGRYARFFADEGVTRGDVVALLMDNRPDFLFVLAGLARRGAVGALINHNLVGRALVHAIEVGRPVRVIVGGEHLARVEEVRAQVPSAAGDRLWLVADPAAPLPEGAPGRAIDAVVAGTPPLAHPDAAPCLGSDVMCLIYTSGTTGLPKAAIVTHQRWLLAAALFGKAMAEAGPDDVLYMTLPLYHSTGMFAGWGASLATGCAMALRRKFSASAFWADVERTGSTIFVYIGELCRYLLNHPERPEERRHRLRLAMGNGLRPDVWARFQERFGIPLVREFYGATEGNAPLVNLEGRPGMVGRLRIGQVLARCDQADGTLWRDENGLGRPVAEGERGLLLGRISGVTRFDGYVDAQATEKKILCDVFEKGDRWFDSGDLLQLHEDGWVSFVDRVGDTFRWKGENVSTNEVAEILNGARGVLESNVYGVRVCGAEGRAGMASLNVGEGFDLDEFAAFVLDRLPPFQRPWFVRLQTEMRVTSTFKHQKVDYREEGFDPVRVSDPLYFLDGRRYVPIDAELHRRLAAGEIGPG